MVEEASEGVGVMRGALQVKVLKGLRRVIVREQRCAAEERTIQRERIPQADSVVPCSLGFKAANHTCS